jgi:hypothetical protein
MEKHEHIWKQDGRENAETLLFDRVVLQWRLQRADAEICRLTRCVQQRDRQLCELQKVPAHLATPPYSVELGLPRQFDAFRTGRAADEPEAFHMPGGYASREGVVIRLPYVTSILSVLFDAMSTFWADCDPAHLPKSCIVARAIDECLGLSAKGKGEGSRSGQAYASAIRPDCVKDADGRHHQRWGAQR